MRTGNRSSVARLDLPMLRRLFYTFYREFQARYYFQQYMGFECVDSGMIDGVLGNDIDAAVFWRLRKDNVWPIDTNYSQYTEDDLFDIVELLYDCVSKPIEGWYHQYNGCGWHYDTYDQDAGQKEFRAKINQLLFDYRDGYELSEAGEILESGQPWAASLLNAKIPSYDPVNVEARLEAAILKFRRRGTPIEDKRDAVRDLAGVLEFLRPKLKHVFNSKDESDLFNIANNFSIRHHGQQQKRDYDLAIWCSWMFYFYLATIHAALRLIQRHEATGP
ncbi:MAG TPA: hypothetical protein VII06_39815 [Chloroflexota bacterium]|jgi:hypothetical protein